MATKVPPFSSAQLTQLAHLLDGPTGTELDRMLNEARIPIADPSTKWRRLRESFEREQRRTGCANAVAKLVKIALTPANYIGQRENFEDLRSEVNQVLGFSGLRLEADGTLRRVSETHADRSRATRRPAPRQAHRPRRPPGRACVLPRGAD